MQTSDKYVIAKENVFISNILSACRQVTNMLQQIKICSYLIYTKHVDKSQICLQQKKICSYLIYSQHVDKSQIFNIKRNMFISSILSACRHVKNVLQKNKICSHLIYSQHVDNSQICYSKRKQCSYLIYSQNVDKSQLCYSQSKYVHI